jgi:hypothetical protein
MNSSITKRVGRKVAYVILVGKPLPKSPLARTRKKRKETKMDPRE